MSDPGRGAAVPPNPDPEICEIIVRKNGSLRVTGKFRLLDHEGKEIPQPVGKKPGVALCRCGQSLRKPFCDSAHKTCGFFDPPEPPPASAP
jgi:CDGSH-type Zn-finger protein